MAGSALRKAPLYPPGVQSAVDYSDDVIAGRVDAGRLVHLSCERFRRDIDERIWEFRDDLAERAMDFAGQMPNIKGPEAGHLLRLMPWQRLVFANLFGFVEPGTNTRRFRQGVVFVPRGNGKTTFAAPLALYMTFMDDEGGAPRRAILLRLPAAFGLGATRFCLGRLRFSNPFSGAV
jgi:phage terminase large subunit-like protein